MIVSPFGIFFADGGNAPDAVSPSAAVAQLNRELADRLEELTPAERWPFPVYSDLLFSV